MTAKIEISKAYPLEATPMDGGVNFSVYAHRAEAVELLLFDHADDWNKNSHPPVELIKVPIQLAGL